MKWGWEERQSVNSAKYQEGQLLEKSGIMSSPDDAIKAMGLTEADFNFSGCEKHPFRATGGPN